MQQIDGDCKFLTCCSIVSFSFSSDFIWDFGKLPFPTHLGKYFIKIGKIRAKIHEIGKIKAIFGLGMTPIYGLKNGQIKSLFSYHFYLVAATTGGLLVSLCVYFEIGTPAFASWSIPVDHSDLKYYYDLIC